MSGVISVLVIGVIVAIDLVLIFKDRPASRQAAARIARAGLGALLGAGTSRQGRPGASVGGSRPAPPSGRSRVGPHDSDRQWPGATSPFRVGDRVTPKRAIHRPAGTAWPGAVGVVVGVGDGGPFPDALTVRFGHFTANAVFANELRSA
jgi:hypothetical protein